MKTKVKNKTRSRLRAKPGSRFIYIDDVGGGSSLTVAAVSAALFRNMTNPTTTGMATKIIPPQQAPNPVSNAVVGSLLPPILISAPGTKLTIAASAPQHRLKRPGQPQHSAVTAVAIIPAVLFSMDETPFCSLRILRIRNKQNDLK